MEIIQQLLKDDCFQRIKLLNRFSDEQKNMKGSLLVAISKKFSQLQQQDR